MDEAKELFAKGVGLFEIGKHASALEEFKKSFEKFPHWKIMYNIGMCYVELDDLPAAANRLSFFIDEGKGRIDESVLSEVKGTLKFLRGKVGTLRLTGGYEGGELEIDGKINIRGSEGKDVYVKPGVHHIKLTMSGKTVIEKDITIETGEEKEIFIVESKASMEDEKADSGESKPDAGELSKGKLKGSKKMMRDGAWALLGIFLATVVAGSVTGGLAIQEKNKMKDKEKEYREKEDRAGTAELEEIESERDSYYELGMHYSNASTALFVVGGISAVAAVVLFPLSLKRTAHERKTSLKIYCDFQSAGLIMHF